MASTCRADACISGGHSPFLANPEKYPSLASRTHPCESARCANASPLLEVARKARNSFFLWKLYFATFVVRTSSGREDVVPILLYYYNAQQAAVEMDQRRPFLGAGLPLAPGTTIARQDLVGIPSALHAASWRRLTLPQPRYNPSVIAGAGLPSWRISQSQPAWCKIQSASLLEARWLSFD